MAFSGHRRGLCLPSLDHRCLKMEFPGVGCEKVSPTSRQMETLEEGLTCAGKAAVERWQPVGAAGRLSLVAGGKEQLLEATEDSRLRLCKPDSLASL